MCGESFQTHDKSDLVSSTERPGERLGVMLGTSITSFVFLFGMSMDSDNNSVRCAI